MVATSEPELLTMLERARSLAAGRGHDRIATLHLFAALLESLEGVAARALTDLGADVIRLRRRVEDALPPAAPPVDPSELAYSANAARTLESAARRAGIAGHDAIRTEHLLGALAAPYSNVAALLRAAGVSEEALVERTDTLARGDRSVPAAGFLSLDPGNPAPAYQQIVDRIREAVAEGRLQPNDRLPTVRQLAADLKLAPGTTARAYQQLEQLGVVTAEGPKGTRVARQRAVEVPAIERTATLVGLLRPVAVAASYLGASADEVRSALEHAITGILAHKGGDARSA